MNKLYYKNKTKINKKIILFFGIIFSLLFLYSLIPQWQITALQVAYSRPHEIYVFDCDDFSKLLVERLTEQDYNAYMEISQDAKDGYCNNITNLYEKYLLKRKAYCHAWVILNINGKEIPIEATTGLVIDPIKYYNKYLMNDVNWLVEEYYLDMN